MSTTIAKAKYAGKDWGCHWTYEERPVLMCARCGKRAADEEEDFAAHCAGACTFWALGVCMRCSTAALRDEDEVDGDDPLTCPGCARTITDERELRPYAPDEMHEQLCKMAATNARATAHLPATAQCLNCEQYVKVVVRHRASAADQRHKGACADAITALCVPCVAAGVACNVCARSIGVETAHVVSTLGRFINVCDDVRLPRRAAPKRSLCYDSDDADDDGDDDDADTPTRARSNERTTKRHRAHDDDKAATKAPKAAPAPAAMAAATAAAAKVLEMFRDIDGMQAECARMCAERDELAKFHRDIAARRRVQKA